MKDIQAFPTGTGVTPYNPGMTLRDYFAAKAMQDFAMHLGAKSDDEWFDQAAQASYRLADAMLKAREAK